MPTSTGHRAVVKRCTEKQGHFPLNSNLRRAVLSAVALCGVLCASTVCAQIVINEILADNESTLPLDIEGDWEDMVELYNPSDEIVVLGTGDPSTSWALCDREGFDPDRAWIFPVGRASIPPGGRIVIFCDGAIGAATCELHASFAIDNDGTEPISLWGPEETEGDPLSRSLADQVWPPPLGDDVAIGRFPDGAGPTPVPREETLEHLVVFPPGSATFGACANLPGICIGGAPRFCGGGRNGPGGNIAPRVSRAGNSLLTPAAGESVEIVARVRDNRVPTPENIASVRVVYRVTAPDGSLGSEVGVELVYDEDGPRSGAY